MSLHAQVWNNWWSRVKDLPGEKRVRINEVTVAPGHVIDLDVELTEKGLKVSERGLTFTGFSLGEIEATINFTAAWPQLRGITAGGETQLFHLLAAREISAQTRRAGLRVVKGEK